MRLDYLGYLLALEFIVSEQGISNNANAFPDIWLMDKRIGSIIH